MLVSHLEEHKSAAMGIVRTKRPDPMKVTAMANGGISQSLAVPSTSLPVGVATV